LEAAWQAAFDVDRSFEDTVRIAKPDGSTLWVTVTAAPLHNELGSITGYMGTMTDISNVVLQHAEEEAERELAMVAVRDAPVEELLMVVTERVRELFGVAVCVIVRFDAEGMVTRVAASPDQPYLDHTFKLEKGMVAEVVLRTGRPVNSNLLTSGTDVVTKLNAFGLKISAGAPIYVGGRLWGAFIISDAMAGRVGPAAAARLTRFADRASAVIAHADARLLLEHLAATDSLTDLPNRRIFDETLRSEITRSTRYRRSLAVIVIDLDGFKNANDTAGHNAGDQLLQAVSSRMVRTARAAETIARIGGDEFGWILPEADETMASEAAARLLFAIGSESVGKIGTVTASAGVAIWAEGEEADELVRRADVAMYRAKAEGGNTFWVAEA
jgi:diguanylate cyclase (GGDEF)-like protein